MFTCLLDDNRGRDIIAPMNQEDFKAGASAARNKLAGFLRDRGLDIPSGDTPPENEDFWCAIQEFAERHGATLPPLNIEDLPQEDRWYEASDKHGRRIRISPALARTLESLAKKRNTK